MNLVAKEIEMVQIQCQVCGIVDLAKTVNDLPANWFTGAFVEAPYQTGFAFCTDCADVDADRLIIKDQPLAQGDGWVVANV